MNETPVEIDRKAFVLPSRVLDILGGRLIDRKFTSRTLPMVEEGGYLWGVDHLQFEKVEGVFNHSCRVGRGAEIITKALRDKSMELQDGKYEDADPHIAAEAGVIHDIAKIPFGLSNIPKEGSYIAGVENLSSEEKERLGLPPDLREISPGTDRIVIKWIEDRGFPKQVIETVVGHDFPVSEEAVETVYQAAVIWADYCCSNNFIGTDERLRDVFDRWIKPFVINLTDFEGMDSVQMVIDHWRELDFGERKPRIEPEIVAKAAGIILGNRDRLFNYLGMSEGEFIEKARLNDDAKMPPWESVLRKSWKKDFLHQESGGVGSPKANHVKSVLSKKNL